MGAGKYRHKITLQKNSPTKNDANENVDQWEDIGTVWTAIIPLSGHEMAVARQINSVITHRIEIQYTRGGFAASDWLVLAPAMPTAERTPISSTLRGIYGTRIFDVLSAINLQERNREIHLLCVEVGTS